MKLKLREVCIEFPFVFMRDAYVPANDESTETHLSANAGFTEEYCIDALYNSKCICPKQFHTCIIRDRNFRQYTTVPCVEYRSMFA